MNRTARMAWIGAAICTAGLGCAHFLETQTVARFAAALEKQDLKSAQSASTDEFNRKALRHAKALEDMQVLNLPDGKVSVVKVRDVKRDGEITGKDVTVEVGKRKRKLLYQLVKDRKTGKWLVDDIRIKQQRRGATVAKPLTEQMDLLITVREFLEGWDGGRRSDIVKVVTPKLGKELQSLPAGALLKLAREVVGKRDTVGTLRPKAELDGDAAIVTLPRKRGKMVLAFRRLDGRWKVTDVAVESRGGKHHLPSLLKKAVVIRTADGFLNAYGNDDRRQLARVCTPRFYGESLKYANVSELPLQSPGETKPELEVTIEKTRAVYTVKEPHRWLRVALVLTDQSDNPDAPTEYLVEDVAVYDLHSRRETRVSSFFTAQVKAQLFADALARRNLTVLDKTSTGDFRRRVWADLDASLLRTLPVLDLDRPRLTIEDTDYRGSVTEVHGRQNGRDVTYVLHDRQGVVKVDDVLVLEYGKPRSLKTTLELLLPIRKFAAGIAGDDIRALQRNSSNHFTRMVWKQTRAVPRAGRSAPRYLERPIEGIARNGQEVIVTLGDERQGAKVLLVNEHTKYVVHDAMLIDERSKEPLRLKKALRAELAKSGALLPDPSRVGRNNTLIGPASATRTDELGFDRTAAPATRTRQNQYADPDGSQVPTTHTARRYDPIDSRISGIPAITVDPQGAAFQDDRPSKRDAGRSGHAARRTQVPAAELDKLLQDLPAGRYGRR
ncbi:MAG: hypothetical protein ACE5KM_08545 [Planctomycetaceae bacterium]